MVFIVWVLSRNGWRIVFTGSHQKCEIEADKYDVAEIMLLEVKVKK